MTIENPFQEINQERLDHYIEESRLHYGPKNGDRESARRILLEKIETVPGYRVEQWKEEKDQKKQLITDSNTLAPGEPDLLSQTHKVMQARYAEEKRTLLYQPDDRYLANNNKKKGRKGWGKYRNLSREQFCQKAKDWIEKDKERKIDIEFADCDLKDPIIE